MKGYSKIQLHGSTKSRSMDFSDLTHHLPQTPRKPTNFITTSQNQLASKEDQEAKQIKTHETHLEEDQETKQVKTHETHLEEDQEETKQVNTHKTQLESEEEDNSGEKFGVILRRNFSVSSSSATSSHRFRFERGQNQENNNLQSAVKRAFSMRRSSSVAERYSKIHDQYVTLSSSFQEDDGEDEEVDKNSTVMKKKKKKNQRKNKILKACKRIFGL